MLNKLFSRLLLVRLLLVLLASYSETVLAEQIRVAVASNFTNAITEISQQFEQQTGHQVTLIFGSTGKHFAQISHGAPYDIFLAADSARPQRLEDEGLAITGSRFTYALGKLVLWSPQKNYVNSGPDLLATGSFNFLSIANPSLAPYGKAAREVLLQLELWQALAGKIVRGENIGQTLQFVRSKNAQLGFIAESQYRQIMSGSIWQVPQALYSPIEQQAVLLKVSDASTAFMAFMKDEKALAIIDNAGYDLP